MINIFSEDINDEGFCNIEMFNSFGQLVYQTFVNIDNGMLLHNISCKELNKGVYHLRISTTGKEIRLSKKLIIQ